MTVRKMMDDPNDLTRLTDDEILVKMMKLYLQYTEYRRKDDLVAAAAAKTVVDLHRYEALRRMKRSDPVLRDANG
jgi:hypothetical protein